MRLKKHLGKSAAVITLSLGLALSAIGGFASSASASPVATATVNKGVNFRSGQSTSASIIGFVKAGTVLPVEAANNYWVLVDYNGRTGYVSRSYVTVQESGKPQPNPSSGASGSAIVNTAKSYLGKVRYVFGERDQKRLVFDCSSFTQYVFQLNGKSIPWGSKAQARIGSYVSRSQLKAGDLVFFSVSKPGQINHVGIYMGNGRFINNLPGEGVVVSDFNSSYWKSHYIRGQRV
ncbi:SH3 domain-containing protein [Paenibacillus sp. UNC496MF]|uniref:C40 family peptidase n=1 Tax=Paenibacillus sp. UNC496MF TaxID=1502753 RepID=UPI0008F3A258|nr:SH3 domain-containing C40 family peptidase [Paenibacillus sp. UNC496MF]SFI38900.1 SH3 domain-containing protein [Paenibacillus sp. UNC496MF]